MRNFFKRVELPPVNDLFRALTLANKYLHPEWNDSEVLFHSSRFALSCVTHKQFAFNVADVCAIANAKIDEVEQLNKQFQLTTEINN
jgi:hypothetical protein